MGKIKTHYLIGDKVTKIPFAKGKRFKLHLSGSDILYRTDGQDPTANSGEHLRARSIFILNATEKPIDFRAIRLGERDTILTIIPFEEVQEE